MSKDKIQGVVRKLRAVMDAFDMRGTNRATMLNAINTIEALRTRPAPAATDTGLECYSASEVMWSLEGIRPTPSNNGQWVKRSQAEELLAGRDVVIETQANSIDKLERKVRHWQERDEKAEELLAARDAENDYLKELVAARGETIKRGDDRIRKLEAKLAAAEKALEEADEALQADAIASAHATIRAVLGGKP